MQEGRINIFSKAYNRIIESNGWLLFLLYFLSSVFLNLTDTTFVNTDIVFAKYLQEKVDSKYEETDGYIDEFKEDLNNAEIEESSSIDLEEISWDALFILIESCITIFFIASIILLSFVLSGYDKGSEFPTILKLTLISHFIFLIPDMLSIFWFLLIQPDFQFQDLINFSPLSILNLLPTQELPGWLLTLLRPINLFEIGFILLLAFGMHLTFKQPYRQMIIRISIYYGGCLYAWKISLLYFSYLL
jgi:hypothetical protein